MTALHFWTIGHSTHEIEAFVGLLRQHGIEAVADVRSQPYSRFNPQFNRESLQARLEQAAVAYVFLGGELGGRPRDPSHYDSEGHALYGEMAKTDEFRAGLERLIDGAQRYRIAMMCSEGDPAECHRRLLVTRVLRNEGVSVIHILPDGSTVTEEDLSVKSDPQLTLLADEEPPWRSVRSVSRSEPQRTSSTPSKTPE